MSGGYAAARVQRCVEDPRTSVGASDRRRAAASEPAIPYFSPHGEKKGQMAFHPSPSIASAGLPSNLTARGRRRFAFDLERGWRACRAAA